MKKLLLFFTFLFSNFMIGQSIVSVSPNNANRNQQLPINITTQGVDFSSTTPTVNVSFIDQFNNILPADYNYFWQNNELTAWLSIPGYAVPGQYDVSVAEENGAFGMTLANGFTVNNNYNYAVYGNVRYDSNANGCDASDINFPNLRLNYTSGSGSGTLITNQSGYYNNYYVQAGTNTITPVLQNPGYFTISPPNATAVLSSSNNSLVQNFCIAPNGTHNDLEVSIVPVTNARPGFDAIYKIVYKNKGTTTQSGSVSFTFNDSLMDLVSATPSASTSGTNSLTWNFSNLAPFEIREIVVIMNINSPTESPAVNVNDILHYTGTISGATDETPENNTTALHQTVRGSFDPNDKTCLQGNAIALADVGKYLDYVIRFENTGTANAEFIVVRDIIDTSKFDISTLTPVSGSHPFTTRISNTNRVEFIFDNINLPFDDANNDGYVAFRIKTKSTLTVGTSINNTANIYFDYNAPITTNTASTTVQNLGVSDFAFGSVFSLSPVPAKDVLNITVKQNVSMSSVNIFNTLGQLIQVTTSPSETIDVSGLRTGTYFIKIVSDRGTATSKFIKE